METVTVSSKYQIVIPRSAREHFQIKPGQKLVAFEYKDHLQLVPVLSIEKLRDRLKGLTADGIREKKDRI